MTKAAKACIARQIKKHCRKKRGKCGKPAARAQAVAIAFSQCKRAGFRVPRR
jgi:hypothetical protein